MDNELKKELKKLDENTFINFRKDKEGWFYFFTDLINDDEVYNKKRDELYYKNRSFNYILGNKLYDIIHKNNSYHCITQLVETHKKDPKLCGVVYSKKFISRKDVENDSFEKLFKIIIEEKIDLNVIELSSLNKTINKLKDIIKKNKLNINLDIFNLNPSLEEDIDILEEYKNILYSIKNKCRIKYKIKVLRNKNIEQGIFDDSNHRFCAAMGALSDSIESILYDYINELLDIDGDSIIITLNKYIKEDDLALTIKGAFHNKYDNIYPEFLGYSVSRL